MNHLDQLKHLRALLEKTVLPNILKWDESQHFPSAVFDELHKMGILQQALPEKFGGKNATMEQMLDTVSLIAEYSPGIVSGLMGNLAAQTALVKHAHPELCFQIFSDQGKSGKLMSFCATELETGTDIGRLKTTARPSSNSYSINGNKNYITNAVDATHFVVLARLEENGFQSGRLAAFYVPANSPGVSLSAPLKKLGQNESQTAHIQFKNVRIPSRYKLEGDGYEILETCISRTKALLAGATVGMCLSARSQAIDYLSSTERYGKTLLDLPEIKTQLAHLQVQMEAARALAEKACKCWDAHGKSVSESSAAKYFGANTAMKYVASAIELCGASGYMAEHRLSKLFRDVKLIQIYEGASLVQLAIISKTLFPKKNQPKGLKLAS